MIFTDIILLIIIIVFAIHGFVKGLIHELASLAGLILGIYLSLKFSDQLKDFLVDFLNIQSKFAYITAFILIFIAVVITIYFAGKLLQKIFDLVALGLLNRIAGSAFGAVKAIVLISLFILLINHFKVNLISEKKKEDSVLYKPIESVAPFIFNGFGKFRKEIIPDDSKPLNDNIVWTL